ncbi:MULTISPECIES: TetR/AcrR family transcriptional regulator [Rhodococcus]|uniref:TetR/AcrR family transcriptional regulator n=1 Tax=Rhodococcus aetherivorans TaxID=191292 RepID=A0A059MKW7_9NOCA|nr:MULTISPECIES: TetR/AcrR family transcriptional regulator [Rhodococcus]ETT27185.1 transcriptional regulator, TetR family [Rhodococcus rhodochrous ATCC 21198]AKE91414.1 TetR family transcriptional regulator [Rhodococcus aetherivorans]ANZ23755.1 TetR family transcriptional regulator [Rhodococcus sp. WB1]KDE11805.1 TetR family transcriptional regulator [Rhodococcus aetherivorans]MBC2589172.1 TetR/AcrR family transcriptional regulator [Rhodococcus aetherivorans]
MATEDRRVRRTKRLLRDALVTLVLERGYGAVTVEDIAERADLSRATFYGHYTDKDDLFGRIVADLIAELNERLRPLVTDSSAGFTGKPVLEMFRHAAEERDVYRVILRGEGDGRALREFMDDRSEVVARIFRKRADAHGVTPRIDVDVLARAWVGEQISVLRWWIESDPPVLPLEDVTEMLLELSLRGRYWANGFDGPPPGAGS